MSKPKRALPQLGGIPGRTFERTQGCYNCVKFENDQGARSYWLNTCRPRDLRVVKALEIEGKLTQAAELRRTVAGAHQAVMAGKFGLCTAGRAKSDFVAHNHLCDGWTARQGASVAREGAAPDLLPDELKEIVDGGEN